MRKFLILGAMLALVCFSFGAAAKADTVGSLALTDCGGGVSGCPGATYSFDIGTTSATLKITINSAVGSTNDYITVVDLGFTSDSNVPTGLTVTGPTAGWLESDGPLSSGGTCGGVSGAFLCTSAPSLTSLPISSGNSYMWTWNYDAIDPSVILSDVHVGAEYGPNRGNWKGLIVSQTVATPEPATFTLLGLGLVGAGLLRRRK